MAKFKYELVDYEIREQDLSLEDLQYLLSANLVSPFAMVRRVKEITAYPILSHPDFSSEVLNTKPKTRSANCIRFLSHLQRIRKAARGVKVNDEDTFNSRMTDRRRPLPTVLIKAPQEKILGALVNRQGRLLTILTPYMGLKIGQILEFEIYVSYKKERLTGKVRVFTEKIDRRDTSRILYTYEVEHIQSPANRP